MKNIILLLHLVLGLTTMALPAQEPEGWSKKIQQEWVLKEGWWGDQQLVFERKNPAVHKDYLYRVFAFNADQSIAYELYNPNSLGMCGNGRVFIKEGSWQKDEQQQLFVSLVGGRYLEKRFEFSAKFAITKLNESQLSLRLVEEITNKKMDF